MIPLLLEHEIYIGEILDIKIENNCIKFIAGTYNDFNYKYASIGFRVLDFYYKNNIRIITSIEIFEVSFTENPAQINTSVKKIKNPK